MNTEARQPIPPFDNDRFKRVRWTVFLLLVLSYIGVYFHRMAPGVVSADLMQAFATSGAALGSLAAMYYYVYTAMQIPAGVLADTLGPRASVAIGALVSGAGSVLFGLAPDFDTASVGRLLVGLGVSVVFVGLMKSNTVWFDEKSYGKVSGATLMLGNLGSVLAAGPLAALLGLLDWRDVFVGAGIASMVVGLLTWLLVRNSPEHAGFPSIREQQGLPAHPPREHHWLRELKTVVTFLPVWPGFWMMFGVTGTLFAFAGLWGVPLMRDVHGLDRADASLYTTATLLAFALSTMACGWLSDHLGRRKPVIVGMALLSVLSWLALAALPWSAGIGGMALYALLGFAAGGFVVGYPAAKEILPPAVSGMAIALVNMGLFLGAAIMQPAFGWVMDLSWDGTMQDGVRIYSWANYQHGLLLSAGFALLGLVASLRIRETHGRNIAVRSGCR